MNVQLYVKCLDLSINDIGLKSLFSSYGKVISANVDKHSLSKSSKGTATVIMASELDAVNCIDALNNKLFHGKIMSIHRNQI